MPRGAAVQQSAAPRRDTVARNAEGAPGVFEAARLRLESEPPSPLPRFVLRALIALLVVLAFALAVGRVDVVAIADGRLVPRTLLKIVQPADAGVVREILVDEGAAVLAGQPLLRLDARIADADLRAQRTELALRALQVRRVDAELDGAPFVREAADPGPLFERTSAQLRANREAHADAMAHAAAQAARIAQELFAATEIEQKLSRTAPIAQTVAARYERLRDEGFVSELFALERERDRIEREHELRAQRHTVRALHASLEQAQRQRDQLASSHRRQLHIERAEASAHTARLREEIDKQLVRREHVELEAPHAGIVKDLAVRTRGTVVAPGTVLLTIVPAGDPLEAEVLVRNEDAGFVRTGQRTQVKIAPFPFQKYGLVEGEVVRIGPDATEPAAERAAAVDAGGYRARIALAAQSLPADEARLPFLPGMQVSAEIHLGRRPVVDYVLAPLRKAWHEAARER